MKFYLSKAEYDALPPEQQGMYKASGEGFQVSIEGLPDYAAMENKLNTLLDEKKKGKEAQTAAEAAAQAKAEEAARLAGDVAALDKSWGDKLAKAMEANEALKKQYHGQMTDLMVTNQANELATRLFGASAGPLAHNVLKRLSMEQEADGKFKTRVLDANGQPSAATMDDLYNEFAGDKALKPFLVTTKAQGPSGATHGAPAGAPPEAKNGKIDSRAIALAAAKQVADSQ